MNERSQLWRILEALFVCAFFAALYAAGGSGDFGGQKWLRRFLAPALFAVWAFIRSGFDWRYFVQMPLMFGALCLPYGSDVPIVKVLLRSLFGLANGTASVGALLLNKKFIVPSLHIFLCVAVSVVSGVLNPFQNAMVEQFVIGFIIIFLPAMCVNKKDK